jgi:hypothetical protein
VAEVLAQSVEMHQAVKVARAVLERILLALGSLQQTQELVVTSLAVAEAVVNLVVLLEMVVLVVRVRARWSTLV